MVQFYFLAVCLNIIGGLVLGASSFKDRIPGLSVFRKFIFDNTTLRVGLISSILIVGILKFVSVFIGDILVVGDLLPALTLLVSGFTLLVEYMSEKNDSDKAIINKMDSIFVKHSSIVGIAAIVAGSLHFIFPGVLFL